MLTSLMADSPAFSSALNSGASEFIIICVIPSLSKLQAKLQIPSFKSERVRLIEF